MKKISLSLIALSTLAIICSGCGRKKVEPVIEECVTVHRYPNKRVSGPMPKEIAWNDEDFGMQEEELT